jgi:hypothetical protein
MGLFKSPMQALYARVDRGGFSGGVSAPGATMPEIERTRSGRVVERVARTGNSDPAQSPNIVARLLHLSPISPALQKQRDELVAYLIPLLADAEELEATLIEYRQKTLEGQLVEHRAKCRKQRGLVNSLRGKLNAAELTLINKMAASENEMKILQGLRDLKADGNHVPQWPTAAEIDEFESLYAKQQDKMRTAGEHVNAALTARNALVYELEPVEKEMARLIGEEARLNSEVTQQPFVDLELGLESVPSGVTT